MCPSRIFLDCVAQAAAFYLNCANYTAEVRAFFGREDIMVPYFLVLLNVFSPHRFLAAPDELSAVTPIHARLLQCFYQYLERTYAHTQLSLPPSTPSSRSALGPEQSPIRPYDVQVSASADGEAEQFTIYGEPSAPLAALAPADRARFIALIDYSRISSRVLASRQQASYSSAGALAPNPYSSINCVDWRWLFDFCVAALNDVRVDEVSQRDYEMRMAISSKFTPLIAELLNPLSSLTPSETHSS